MVKGTCESCDYFQMTDKVSDEGSCLLEPPVPVDYYIAKVNSMGHRLIINRFGHPKVYEHDRCSHISMTKSEDPP